jgi:hypothetical protein
MTVEEFKKIKPEYKDAQSDELLDAMTNYMLRVQAGEQIAKSILPFWKTHTLRWLYYRRIPSWEMGKPGTDKYTSPSRCSSCKKGVNMRLMFMDFTKNESYSICPHCSERYIEEPNTNLSHKIYLSLKWVSKFFWTILDRLHLVRSSHSERYDMFGDESRYVKYFSFNYDTGDHSVTLKKRKWWEHIFIERRRPLI